MIKSLIKLQDLRRKIYLKAKAQPHATKRQERKDLDGQGGVMSGYILS